MTTIICAVPDSLPWTRERLLVTGGLMLAMFVAAMDATVVGTALPTIAHQLGQVELYPWIFAGYLLTSTTSVPLWGRMADLHGRKPVLLAGLAAFVGGSLLCAASPNMAALIIFRAVQGIGAGCLQPVTLTVVGDIFPVAQRARLQGLFSAMWAIAAAIGPLIGGVFVVTIGWRWVFLINLPIGLVCTGLFMRYREQREPAGRQRLDYLGAVILTAGVAVLLYGLGTGNPSGRAIWPAAAGGAALLVFFFAREFRSDSPTIPVRLLRDGLIGPAIGISMLAGTLMFGVNAYLPLYVQTGLGRTALEAGWAVAPLSVGWPIASTIGGRVLIRVGYQAVVATGAFLLFAGALLLLLTAHLGPVAVGAGTLVIGMGLGAVLTPILIVVQNAVPWQRRGAITALNQFSRTIGGAVGVSLMGILVEARLGSGPLLPGPRVQAAIQPVFWSLLGLGAAVLVGALGIVLAAARARRTEAAEAAG
jgi:EmrB/QacA subfamily drug resistance transporter